MSPRKKDDDVKIEMSAEEEALGASAEATAGQAASAETEEKEPGIETGTRRKRKRAGNEGEVIEASVEAKADQAVSAETEEKESDVETDAVTKSKEPDVGDMSLKVLSGYLYQMGLDRGLPPDEAALLTGETKLPPFITEAGEREFKEGLLAAYQEMLDERLQSLKHKLNMGA